MAQRPSGAIVEIMGRLLMAVDDEAACAVLDNEWDQIGDASWRCDEHVVDDESEGDRWIYRVLCPDGDQYIVDASGVTTRQE